MPKTPSRELATITNLSALPERFEIADTEIRPEQMFVRTARHPRGAGPWADEPDKLAWIDAASGLPCILLRQASGALSGYVGVAPTHPLWGYEVGAIPPSSDIQVHGGIDYAELCAAYGPEEERVCHVHQSHDRRVPVGDGRSDDAWWLGFTADKPGDLVPRGNPPRLSREEGETYRDIDFMYRETVGLARQLRALQADPNTPPLKLGAPAPKLGKS